MSLSKDNSVSGLPPTRGTALTSIFDVDCFGGGGDPARCPPAGCCVETVVAGPSVGVEIFVAWTGCACCPGGCADDIRTELYLLGWLFNS